MAPIGIVTAVTLISLQTLIAQFLKKRGQKDAVKAEEPSRNRRKRIVGEIRPEASRNSGQKYGVNDNVADAREAVKEEEESFEKVSNPRPAQTRIHDHKLK
uniref:Uncharacterized protein n=1 Tax=Angiostrongylus cantonensis TaxID=6313 RepID=A0A158PBB2_ANGCA